MATTPFLICKMNGFQITQTGIDDYLELAMFTKLSEDLVSTDLVCMRYDHMPIYDI